MKYKGYTITKSSETYMENVGYRGIYSDKSDRKYEEKSRDIWLVQPGFKESFRSLDSSKIAIRHKIRESSPKHKEYMRLQKKIKQMEKRLDKLGKWLKGGNEMKKIKSTSERLREYEFDTSKYVKIQALSKQTNRE